MTFAALALGWGVGWLVAAAPAQLALGAIAGAACVFFLSLMAGNGDTLHAKAGTPSALNTRVSPAAVTDRTSQGFILPAALWIIGALAAGCALGLGIAWLATAADALAWLTQHWQVVLGVVSALVVTGMAAADEKIETSPIFPQENQAVIYLAAAKEKRMASGGRMTKDDLRTSFKDVPPGAIATFLFAVCREELSKEGKVVERDKIKLGNALERLASARGSEWICKGFLLELVKRIPPVVVELGDISKESVTILSQLLAAAGLSNIRCEQGYGQRFNLVAEKVALEAPPAAAQLPGISLRLIPWFIIPLGALFFGAARALAGTASQAGLLAQAMPSGPLEAGASTLSYLGLIAALLGTGVAVGLAWKQLSGRALGGAVRGQSRLLKLRQKITLVLNQTFYSLLVLSAKVIPSTRKKAVVIMNRLRIAREEILPKTPPIIAAKRKPWNRVKDVLLTASSLFSVQNIFAIVTTLTRQLGIVKGLPIFVAGLAATFFLSLVAGKGDTLPAKAGTPFALNTRVSPAAVTDRTSQGFILPEALWVIGAFAAGCALGLGIGTVPLVCSLAASAGTVPIFVAGLAGALFLPLMAGLPLAAGTVLPKGDGAKADMQKRSGEISLIAVFGAKLVGCLKGKLVSGRGLGCVDRKVNVKFAQLFNRQPFADIQHFYAEYLSRLVKVAKYAFSYLDRFLYIGFGLKLDIERIRNFIIGYFHGLTLLKPIASDNNDLSARSFINYLKRPLGRLFSHRSSVFKTFTGAIRVCYGGFYFVFRDISLAYSNFRMSCKNYLHKKYTNIRQLYCQCGYRLLPGTPLSCLGMLALSLLLAGPPVQPALSGSTLLTASAAEGLALGAAAAPWVLGLAAVGTLGVIAGIGCLFTGDKGDLPTRVGKEDIKSGKKTSSAHKVKTNAERRRESYFRCKDYLAKICRKLVQVYRDKVAIIYHRINALPLPVVKAQPLGLHSREEGNRSPGVNVRFHINPFPFSAQGEFYDWTKQVLVNLVRKSNRLVHIFVGRIEKISSGLGTGMPTGLPKSRVILASILAMSSCALIGNILPWATKIYGYLPPYLSTISSKWSLIHLSLSIIFVLDICLTSKTQYTRFSIPRQVSFPGDKGTVSILPKARLTALALWLAPLQILCVSLISLVFITGLAAGIAALVFGAASAQAMPQGPPAPATIAPSALSSAAVILLAAVGTCLWLAAGKFLRLKDALRRFLAKLRRGKILIIALLIAFFLCGGRGQRFVVSEALRGQFGSGDSALECVAAIRDREAVKRGDMLIFSFSRRLAKLSGGISIEAMAEGGRILAGYHGGFCGRSLIAVPVTAAGEIQGLRISCSNPKEPGTADFIIESWGLMKNKAYQDNLERWIYMCRDPANLKVNVAIRRRQRQKRKRQWTVTSRAEVLTIEALCR